MYKRQEEYIGKLGKKLFLLFCWLFCILVVAAFADVVAGTFNGFVADDAGVVSKVDVYKRQLRLWRHLLRQVRLSRL